jgi:hypothetical protein
VFDLVLFRDVEDGDGGEFPGVGDASFLEDFLEGFGPGIGGDSAGEVGIRGDVGIHGDDDGDIRLIAKSSDDGGEGAFVGGDGDGGGFSLGRFAEGELAYMNGAALEEEREEDGGGGGAGGFEVFHGWFRYGCLRNGGWTGRRVQYSMARNPVDRAFTAGCQFPLNYL